MNINDLLQEIESLKATIKQKDEQINSLRNIIFGRSSEKRFFDNIAKEEALLFNEAEKIITEEAKSPELFDKAEREKPGGRRKIPENIPRDEEILKPEENKLTCKHCSSGLVKIGESVTEKLDIIPQRVIVRKIIRPKYMCKSCEQESTEIIQEPMPKTLLPKAAAGAGFMAHAITGKFADRIPYYHFAKILGRVGLDISRWDLSRWSIDVFEKHLEAPLENLRTRLFQTNYLQIDETTLQVLGNPGKNYMWVVHGELSGKKISYFHYRPSRSADFLTDWLENFQGVIQTDGLETYNTHLKNLPGVLHAGCNVHARRKFTECEKSPEQEFVLNQYSRLYKIESDLSKANAPPDIILQERKEKSLPILEGLRNEINIWCNQFTPSGNFGKAVKYFLKEYDKLIVYIEHPHVRPDTNLVENAIRPFAVGRKNWLFSGNEAGARASAGLYSLVHIANLNGWDPYKFLLELFLKIEATDGMVDLVDFIKGYSPGVP